MQQFNPQEQYGEFLLRIVKDPDGWATNEVKKAGLYSKRVAEGFKLRGVALELSTMTLLRRLYDCKVRAKLQIAFWVL